MLCVCVFCLLIFFYFVYFILFISLFFNYLSFSFFGFYLQTFYGKRAFNGFDSNCNAFSRMRDIAGSSGWPFQKCTCFSYAHDFFLYCNIIQILNWQFFCIKIFFCRNALPFLIKWHVFILSSFIIFLLLINSFFFHVIYYLFFRFILVSIF